MGSGDEPAQRGLLFAAGLITGEALMGIVLAMRIALAALWPSLGADPFTIFSVPPLDGWPGLVMVTLVGFILHRTTAGPSGDRCSSAIS